MFFLCVNTINIKKIKRINIVFSEKSVFSFNDFITFSSIKLTAKTVKVENIDDTEEYLKIRDTTNQVNIKTKDNWSDRANNIPKYVATPFPPLNFNQNGNRWPKKANKHDKSIKFGKNSIVIITGRYPFVTSKNNVIAAITENIEARTTSYLELHNARSKYLSKMDCFLFSFIDSFICI